MQENVLTGKVVLITTAARGAWARRLPGTLHADGMNLVIHYRASKDDAHALQVELEKAPPTIGGAGKG